jgi:Leucine Rich Repeat (LRR) protein
MAAHVLEDRLILDEDTDIATLPTAMFPVVHDFELRLRDTDRFGVHLDFASTADGLLAGFPWWDHADADLRRMPDDEIPLGTADRPFHDIEQGWQIWIWERDDHVLILEGDNEEPSRYRAWFAVPKALYLAAWRVAVARTRAQGGAFKSLADALEQPELVRALEIGNQRLTELPIEVCSLHNLESLNLYLNQLTSLPPEFGKLKRLRWLDLRFNQIETLPDELASLESLVEVNLAENQLRTIPPWVATLPALKTFYVRGNPVEAASLDWIRRKRPRLDVGYR